MVKVSFEAGRIMTATAKPRHTFRLYDICRGINLSPDILPPDERLMVVGIAGKDIVVERLSNHEEIIVPLANLVLTNSANFNPNMKM